MPQRRVLRVWRLANGRLERPNNRGLCAGKGQAATLEQQRLTARGLGESGARDLEGFKSFKCLKPGKWMPQRRVLRVWRLANGRLERPNNRGLCACKGQAGNLEQQRLTAEGLVEAAAREPEGLKSFKCLKPSKRMPQRRVLRVWRLANGRLERRNNRGLCAGKGQAATLEQQRLTARGRGGSCREGSGTLEQQRLTARGLGGSGARDLEGFKSLKCLKPGKWMPQRRVLRVWRLANGRLERPNNRGLCAGKGQAATLEQQRLTARGLGGSCREGSGGF